MSSCSTRVLVLAEHNGRLLSSSTPRLLSVAQKFALPVDLLVTGHNCSSVADEAARLEGVEQVLMADCQELLMAGAEDLAALLLPLMKERYDVLLAPDNGAGRELIPRLAALLDVSPLSNVTRIMEPDLFERPIHAGAALAQIRLSEPKKLMTVRIGTSPPMHRRNDMQAPAKIVPINNVPLATRAGRLIGEEFFWKQASLETAPIVIGVGRGAQDPAIFSLIERLANHLNAVIGGTRVAVELGLVPNHVQIGQTGKTIAPKLYIALGISGAVQHLAGIREAQTIVALNKDPDAPLFKLATYGLVGDLHDLLPKLLQELTAS